MNKAISQLLPLDGEWDFTYQATPGEPPVPPAAAEFTCRMPVPAFWDDHLPRLEKTSFWSRDCHFNPFRPIRFPLGQGKPPDCSLPFLVGVGWYRRRFPATAAPLARLVVGGAVMDVTVFVNGRCAGTHEGHLTPAEFEIAPLLAPDGDNEIILAVSNRRAGRASCVIRGYKGRSGGIYAPVSLHLSRARVENLHLYPHGDRLHWRAETAGEATGLSLAYSLRDPGGREITTGTVPVSGSAVSWETGRAGAADWSDRQPVLHTAVVEIRRGRTVLDRLEQPFGCRRLERAGTGLLLNGEPVFLRGLTEHAYFPLTCTPPRDRNSYRENIRRLKAIGFNYLRFHTWTPPEAYLRACDELGMLVQVEAPNGFSDREWTEILLAARRHPAVVLYCCGNESALDDPMIGRLEKLAQECRDRVPEALFCPMHGMSGVDWRLEASAPGVVAEPFPHHRRRLDRLRSFSDVFAPQKGPLGIGPAMDGRADSEARMAIYRRPLLIHEMGIMDSYLDLDLENRYRGTRIGTGLYAAARDYLEREGLRPRAPRYYANACRRAAALRKDYLEKTRLLAPTAGYDYLGAFDNHWHRTGYSVGILNEFYELKPGESAADVRRYNGESILICDLPPRRNYRYRQSLSLPVHASFYGREDLAGATLHWVLRDGNGTVHARGRRAARSVPRGRNTRLGNIDFTLPDLEAPARLELAARLSGGTVELENQWPLWVFPPPAPPAADRRIIRELDQATLQRLEDGEALLLLGTGSLGSLPYAFLMGGRTVGTAATVIEEHPLLESFPHEGFCDWQFQDMLAGARGVVFDRLPFDPIIEFVSSYKLIVKQAALFEWRVGRGRLLACSLALPGDDPAAMYLLNRMTAYLSSGDFQPRTSVDRRTIARLRRPFSLAYDRDEGQDGNALALLEAPG